MRIFNILILGSHVLILDHLQIKLQTLIIITYGIQITHTLVCWNPLSIANKQHLIFLIPMIEFALSVECDGLALST